MPDSSARAGFAYRLRDAMGAHMSIRAFAALAQVSETQLRQYLSGKSEPSRPVLVALAHAANVSLRWLATGEGAKALAAELTVGGATFNALIRQFGRVLRELTTLTDIFEETISGSDRGLRLRVSSTPTAEDAVWQDHPPAEDERPP